MKQFLLNTLFIGLFFSATSQNVGVGTSSPVEKFQIGDRFTFHDGGWKQLGYNYRFDSGDKRVVADEAAVIAFTDGGNVLLRTAISGTANSTITWIDGISLMNNGNVGIGVSGTPLGKLDVFTGGAGGWDRLVVKTTSFWGDGLSSPSETAGTQYVTLGAQASGLMINNPHIVWNQANATAAIRYGRVGGISTGEWWEAGVNGSTGFHIRKNATSASGLEIASNGNVGVADANPETPFVVQNVGERLHVYRPIDNTMAIQVSIDNQWANRVSYASGCCNSLSLQPDVGRVGIGTNSPVYKLDINGDMRTTGRYYSNEWIQMDNHTGLYSPLNGAHFYPNNGSYGAWKVQGSRNGWGGIEFSSAGGDLTLMMNQGNGWGSQYTGVHNNSNGWLWYFLHRSLYAESFVDMNDANFYVDPNNTTRLNVLNSKLNVRGSWGGWNWWGGCNSADYWMIPVSEGNCYLTGLLGSMQGGGEGGYIREESGWYVLRMQTCRGSNSMYVTATCTGR